MAEVLTLIDVSAGCKRVVFENGVGIGDFVVADDGYWGWWPVRERDGYFPAYVLREMADKLDSLNADWDRMVQEGLASES